MQWTGRLVLEDTELGGVPIPAGSKLLLLLGSANRDEAVFTCPADFNPGRQNLKSHLAFGTGIHSCLGAPFARQEGVISIGRLFERLPGLRLAEGHELVPAPSLNFLGPRELRLSFAGRNAS